ncbi:MAG: BNR-4 repeat-containing protein [Prevotella sp.]|nr:BNR-4 repeat-containing protein [Prevotella sp.]
MKKVFLACFMALTAWCNLSALDTFSSNIVADEGAWCWFADPRALHYENEAGTINATYIGYIDVHGNVKATQYDWLTGRKTDVLVRSYFQPDDHNNPTFVVLPDERVMIFYTRHTDEPCIWYRISQKPGDITALGDEKRLATQNNTTYPSPFILSDDPDHVYLCWRGINWHPTIARITMPDENDDCKFDFGPKQIVQSTGARPYAKYQSNGKDKIYVSYTTGHPDNEMPDWLYFNVIDINQGNGPILRDLNGKQLSIIKNGVFNVNKSDSYANSYPATIVDKTANIRNWVWQIALDSEENPVVAYPHIDNAKTTHVYWYARWTGSEWQRTWVQYGGHAFHKNWNSTEKCYSGGMAIDPDHINDLYLSIPTKNGQYNKDGVYEIWKYTINDDGSVGPSEQITSDSKLNNIRPFVIPGSKNSKLRVIWMNGDYYYWMVRQGYPKGFPTGVHADYTWEEPFTMQAADAEVPTCFCFGKNSTLTLAIAMNTSKYEGTLFTIGDNQEFVYSLDGSDLRPVVTINGKSYKSQNCLLTSDDWATQSTGTSGDNHPTKIDTWVFSMTYDGKILTTYRNGLVDQVIEIEDFAGGIVNTDGESDAQGTVTPFNHSCLSKGIEYVCHSPMAVQNLVTQYQKAIEEERATFALEALSLPSETRTDIVLPSTSLGLDVAWTSSDEQVITSDGCLAPLTQDQTVSLTATISGKSKTFEVKGLAREIEKNLRYEQTETLDLTKNTAAGFSTNKYGLAPEGLLSGLRSYTFLLTATAKSLTKAPRFYDFGSGSGNSVFLRANPLSAGIKLNGGTTTMVNGATTLTTGREYKLAVVFEASTHTTRIYIDGVEDASGTANQNEAYMVAEVATDNRNYIGRTQWWDSNYKADNVDFVGVIDGLKLYDVALTREEICELQGVEYEKEELPSELQNGDFEASYSVQQGSGVSSDRAIYVPEGWSVDRANPNENDLTALKAGDYYFSNFFANKPAPDNQSKQTYWIRQNWGSPTLTLSQTLRMAAGDYKLTADIWASGQGGDAYVSVQPEGSTAIKSSSLDSKEEWQQVELQFQSDGEAATTVQLVAQHTASGTEKIIGFDNVLISKNEVDGIESVKGSFIQNLDNNVYDLQGRKVAENSLSINGNQQLKPGVYVSNGRKIVVR